VTPVRHRPGRWPGSLGFGAACGCVLAVAACSQPGASTGGSAGGAPTGPASTAGVSSTAGRSPAAAGSGSPDPRPAAASGVEPSSGSGPAGLPRAASEVTPPGSLRGKVVAIDPGHNGGNGRHPARINRLVDIGNGKKVCDTAGAATDAGYSEAAFTLDVAQDLAALLRARGAGVVLTRSDNAGVGPCIDERAAIGDRAHADAAISIHADGAAATGFGFHVIVPRGIGRDDAIVAPSRRLGVQVRDAFHAVTQEPPSTYLGTTSGAIVARDDLGGLNLSTVPKIFIECANMRNAADAARVSSPGWRQLAARALAIGLTRYLLDNPR
jgi:N-acetylmuramoyl-L-alanine amidase